MKRNLCLGSFCNVLSKKDAHTLITLHFTVAKLICFNVFSCLILLVEKTGLQFFNIWKLALVLVWCFFLNRLLWRKTKVKINKKNLCMEVLWLTITSSVLFYLWKKNKLLVLLPSNRLKRVCCHVRCCHVYCYVLRLLLRFNCNSLCCECIWTELLAEQDKQLCCCFLKTFGPRSETSFVGPCRN